MVSTLDAFNAASDQCFAAPSDCDVDQIVETYTEPDTEAARKLQNTWKRMSDDNLYWTELDGLDRSLIAVEMNDANDYGRTTQCLLNAAVEMTTTADGQPEVVDDTTAYWRNEYFWSKQDDGRWVITESTLTGTLDPAEVPECEF